MPEGAVPYWSVSTYLISPKPRGTDSIRSPSGSIWRSRHLNIPDYAIRGAKGTPAVAGICPSGGRMPGLADGLGLFEIYGVSGEMFPIVFVTEVYIDI